MGSDSALFNLGDIVYMVVDQEGPGMVTGIVFRPHGITYLVTWGDSHETSHYDIELTSVKGFMEVRDDR